MDGNPSNVPSHMIDDDNDFENSVLNAGGYLKM
jgi:hypothetical protein